VAASTPPAGEWPLGLVGIALVDRSVAGASWPARARRGWLAGVALLAPTWWMRDLTAPGWVLFEAVRGRWPFGGMPLSTLAIGQAGGPLAPVASPSAASWWVW